MSLLAEFGPPKKARTSPCRVNVFYVSEQKKGRFEALFSTRKDTHLAVRDEPQSGEDKCITECVHGKFIIVPRDSWTSGVTINPHCSVDGPFAVSDTWVDACIAAGNLSEPMHMHPALWAVTHPLKGTSLKAGALEDFDTFLWNVCSLLCGIHLDEGIPDPFAPPPQEYGLSILPGVPENKVKVKPLDARCMAERIARCRIVCELNDERRARAEKANRTYTRVYIAGLAYDAASCVPPYRKLDVELLAYGEKTFTVDNFRRDVELVQDFTDADVIVAHEDEGFDDEIDGVSATLRRVNFQWLVTLGPEENYVLGTRHVAPQRRQWLYPASFSEFVKAQMEASLGNKQLNRMGKLEHTPKGLRSAVQRMGVPQGTAVIVQEKVDGWRVGIVRTKSAKAAVFSRGEDRSRGVRFQRYDCLRDLTSYFAEMEVPEALANEDIVFDGEVTVEGEPGSNPLGHSFRKTGKRLIFSIFDVVILNCAYEKRRSLLEAMVTPATYDATQISLLPQEVVDGSAEWEEALARKVVDNGWEGVVFKAVTYKYNPFSAERQFSDNCIKVRPDMIGPIASLWCVGRCIHNGTVFAILASGEIPSDGFPLIFAGFARSSTEFTRAWTLNQTERKEAVGISYFPYGQRPGYGPEPFRISPAFHELKWTEPFLVHARFDYRSSVNLKHGRPLRFLRIVDDRSGGLVPVVAFRSLDAEVKKRAFALMTSRNTAGGKATQNSAD